MVKEMENNEVLTNLNELLENVEEKKESFIASLIASLDDERKEEVQGGITQEVIRRQFPRTEDMSCQNRKAGPLSHRHDQRGRNTQRIKNKKVIKCILLLLLSRFICVRLCATS